MQITKIRVAALAFLLVFFAAAMGAGVALAAAQPHMVNARNNLQSALTELDAATANKGGHRTNAMKLIKEAIDEVNLGIRYANTNR